MPKLRNDVIKQALASLSAFIGTVRYSDSFGVATHTSSLRPDADAGVPEPEAEHGAGALFNDGARARLQSAVDHCTEVTMRYGVTVQSVNIISAKPKDELLITQLAAAAVAGAEAEKREIEARGAAKATLIAAQAEADAVRQHALGAKDAADSFTANPVAVDLEKIRLVGDALNDKSTLFFGAQATDLPGIFANPQVVKR